MQEFLIQLIPLMVIQCLLVIGIIPLARKVSPGWAWAWIVATFIPLVGAMMFMFLMMKALAVILERIDLLSATVGSQPRKTDQISHRQRMMGSA
jgi:hypothetical protein